MTEAIEAPEADTDYLSLSDEEVAAMDPNLLTPEEEDEQVEPINQATTEEEEETESDPEGDPADAEPESEEEEDPASTTSADTKDATDTEAGEAEEENKAPAAEEPNYQDFYQRITAPFKANGKELQIANADEAIQLMQMGANYNKKMAALKPNLKMLKLLENNKLLDEQKLSFLIDIDKKNPQAIAKLVKDAGLNPMDIDVDEETQYKPTAYTVDDRVIELDTVLDAIKDTPTYDQTLDAVSTKWDARSKQEIANSPRILEVINTHMGSGVYEVISKELEKRRMFGQLNGLSDIEAYRQVGDDLHANGGFAHLFPTQEQGQQSPPTVQKVISPSKPPANPGLKDKKRAASPPKPASPSKQKPDFNPLSLSDDAFEKLINESLL